MKPLLVLLGAFAIALFATKFYMGNYDWHFAGCVAMSVMLLFTAIGHFVYYKGMIMMLPKFMPSKKAMVFITAIIEIVAAIALLLDARLQQVTAWALMVFFLVILPANIHSAIYNIDYQKANTEGKGVKYLWFRIPLQLFFIAWLYFFAIHLK